MASVFNGLLSSIGVADNKVTDLVDPLSGSFTSGYGDSSGHSASGHSGYGNSKSSGYGHSGGYNDHHSGYGHMDEECCPLVIDLLCLAAILAALAGATVLLGRVIQIEITGLGKRSFMSFLDNVTYPFWLVSGESYL
jgi:hypothetical protein